MPALELIRTERSQTAQVIEELIRLAKWIGADISAGKETGLRDDEIAFYPALADNSAAKEMMEGETLKLIAPCWPIASSERHHLTGHSVNGQFLRP